MLKYVPFTDDSLNRILSMFDVSQSRVLHVNGMSSPEKLKASYILFVPDYTMCKYLGPGTLEAQLYASYESFKKRQDPRENKAAEHTTKDP